MSVPRTTVSHVYPESWELGSVGNLFTLLPNATKSRAEYSADGEVACIHYGDIHTKWSGLLDFEAEEVPRVSENTVRGTPRLRNGDLVVADTSEDDLALGKCIEVAHMGNQQAVAGLHTLLLRPKDDRLESGFKSQVFESPFIKEQVRTLAVGIKVYSLTRRAIKSITIPLPPRPEQRSIASALSHVQEFIAALDALIAKKRAVKQGAMQQLLTGHTRLPGFTDRWKSVALENLAQIVSGGTPSTAVPSYWDGEIPWCTPTDITSFGGIFLTETARTISEEGLRSSSATLLPAGTLLLCTRATIGELKIAGRPMATNQGFKSLICRPGTNNQFLYYLLLTMKERLVERGIGSTFLEVGRRDIASLEVPTPSKGEQDAITSVLTDLDAEIAALEQRRQKSQAIKQGMMQSLLTGRVRLMEQVCSPSISTAPSKGRTDS